MRDYQDKERLMRGNPRPKENLKLSGQKCATCDEFMIQEKANSDVAIFKCVNINCEAYCRSQGFIRLRTSMLKRFNVLGREVIYKEVSLPQNQADRW